MRHVFNINDDDKKKKEKKKKKRICFYITNAMHFKYYFKRATNDIVHIMLTCMHVIVTDDY